MVQIRQLKTFLVVARTLSFTRAASELGYVQSSVTAQIQALERELGVPLFDRMGRRVFLTDAGKRLLPYAERMLDLESEARLAVSGDGEPAGSVVLSASETHCAYRLPGLLSGFRRRHPRVDLKLKPSPVGALDTGLRQSLACGEVDLAFVMEEPLPPEERLEVEPLVAEPATFVAAPGHDLAGRSGFGPEDLECRTVLVTEEGCAYRRVFERALSEAGVRRVTLLEFASVEAIKRCAEAGVGVGMVSRSSVTQEIDRGSLEELPWEGPGCGVLTQVVWRKDRWISPALGAFIEAAREALRCGDGGEAPGFSQGRKSSSYPR
ncbi:LysR family transcriptional regulator [Rubrobacter calidifluminis]|uniref:LysR family transcriptional regulator n=1 Tax=Rubrobacter calidifluminis TaxID=1392640 RepID=UPI002360539B|nr:LysR family transcriptional regulator [Rubrobacter calidifluminis]